MRGVDFRLLNGYFQPIKVKNTVKALDLETVSNDLFAGKSLICELILALVSLG